MVTVEVDGCVAMAVSYQRDPDALTALMGPTCRTLYVFSKEWKNVRPENVGFIFAKVFATVALYVCETFRTHDSEEHRGERSAKVQNRSYLCIDIPCY